MPARNLWSLAVAVAALGAGCGGGGGGGNAGTTSFQVNASVQNGAVWQINREIVFTFSEPVDFSTVSSNTINIRSASDVPATGVFHLIDPLTVGFQPNCPTRDDLSDAGLQPGGVTYKLRIPGLNTSANTLRSTSGVPLGLQQVRTFSTPASPAPSVAFQDTRSGPPLPIVRSQGSSDPDATHLEIGGDPDERVYFELDANDTLTLSEPGFEVPLNLYSDVATRVAVVIAFNQPVNPSSSNISPSRMRLEFLDSASVWRPIDTRVTLIANCTESGASVRLEPIGILPAASEFRAIVRAGFQDLVGEANLVAQTAFAVAPTRTVAFTSLTPADELSDEFNESFSFGGTSPLSFEDTEALFDSPQADWGGGRLAAAFEFEGTGGPNGDFDWVVRTGQIFFFDTTSTPIIGGPDGVPTTTLTAVNGVLDVRNLTIEAGAEIRVQGPNPMRINATGEVRIDGKLDLSGFNAKNVATLNTGNQVETGGAGTCGGGRGGDANGNTSGPTPRGGFGQGPFRQANLGGEGGEGGFNPDENSKDRRRPGGGGGGKFAADWIGTVTPIELSVTAGAGTNGHPDSVGLESGDSPAGGGAPGAGPFLDSSAENNFFGVKPVVSGGLLVGLIRGELSALWAGYGGGGGGNARYQPTSWNLSSDEKGGGGGGGAGGVHIKALGRIRFGAQGRIIANGARGATGENTIYLDHVGGTGGGGSGGHVILESASLVDFTDGGATVGAPLRDIVMAGGPPKNAGPLDNVAAAARGYSNGGAGGAGVIQIHVPAATRPPSDSFATESDIVVPTAAIVAGNPLDQICSPPAIQMIPTFGARSKARSEWISIGGADQEPDGAEKQVRFLFDGIHVEGDDAGKILMTGSSVVDRAPLFQEDDLLVSTTIEVLSGGFTVELTGAALDTIRGGTTAGISNDIYLRTPALLEDCAIRLFLQHAPTNHEDFTIARARYDEGTAALGDELLRLTITAEQGRRLTDFNPGNVSGITGFALMPRFFRAVTNGLEDTIPTSAFVRISFQAARDNGTGAPDETEPTLVPWTSDISSFNRTAPGELQFFRYEIEFDLDAAGAGVTEGTKPVTLDFFKIPFVF